MKRTNKVLLILLSILMIGCFTTGCRKAPEPAKEVKTSEVQSMNKDGKSITTSLKANEYEVVQTTPDNIYDIQIKDKDGIVVMSGQFLNPDDFAYFKDAYIKNADASKTSTKKCNDINYTFIPQGDNNNECSILGELDENNGVMFYSFVGVDKSVEILSSITLTIEEE